MSISINTIKLVVARSFSMPLTIMDGRQRSRKVARPRQVAMYLAKTMTHHSLPIIGRHFGGRDHTTVMHAVRVIESLIDNDAAFKLHVESLREQVSLEQWGDLDGLNKDLNDVAHNAHRAAVYQAKTVPGSAVTGSVSDLRLALKSEFNEDPAQMGIMEAGYSVQLLVSKAGTWSLLQISSDGDSAKLIASGYDWTGEKPATPAMNRMSAPAKKGPRSEQSEQKERPCARCRETFTSHHFGERVCSKCKTSGAWRNPSETRLAEAGL